LLRENECLQADVAYAVSRARKVLGLSKSDATSFGLLMDQIEGEVERLRASSPSWLLETARIRGWPPKGFYITTGDGVYYLQPDGTWTIGTLPRGFYATEEAARESLARAKADEEAKEE